MISMSAVARTHPGLVRDHNEDAVLATPVLAAVADGLGGHAAGEVASRMVLDRMALLVEPVHPEHILAAVAEANGDLLEQVRRNPDQAGMGTTLSGVAIVTVDDAPAVAVFNVGDSRVYRWVGGAFSQVSVDHSEVQELRDAGALRDEDMAHYPRRNIVTRCLGTDPAPRADIWTIVPAATERFVVCSDGLSGEVSDELIAATVAAETDPERATGVLVDQALAAGGRDNISVVVVDVTNDETAPALPAG